MKRAAKIDLNDAIDALEHLVKQLPTLTREEKIDVAARVHGILKAAEVIEESVKGEVKTWLHAQDGSVVGEQWRANLRYYPTTKFDVKRLKVELPETYEQYSIIDEVGRITFGPR